MQALVESARRRDSALVVGLDPVPTRLPPGLLEGREEHEAVLEFCRGILEAVSPYAAAVKVQLAYFERLGPEGMRAYAGLVREAGAAGLPVIADAKRGDIAETAAAYAEAHLRVYGAHCVTVNPYMGADAVLPFLEEARRLGRGGGVFVLVATSNPSAGAFQEASEPPASELAARLVAELGDMQNCGYPDAGAVVGVTRPEAGRRARRLLPRALFLAPGFGAQGGGVQGVRGPPAGSGGGVLVSSSRAILYACGGRGDYRDAAAGAAREARDLLRAAGVRV